MDVKIEALQIAESFNIKKFRSDYDHEAFLGTVNEMFFVLKENNQYLYIFDYGVVVFANYDKAAKNEFIGIIKKYSIDNIESEFHEEYQIIQDENTEKAIVKNAHVKVAKIEAAMVRIVMLNIAQSVALDYYEKLTDNLISSSKTYIVELAKKGKLSISKTNLLKYIGKVLNVKNGIVDNLYILDDPNLVWENEDLNTLNRNLKINFDINARFKDLDYRLQIVEDNLTLFTDVLNVKESKRLEWIIIILIAVEIIISLFFHLI